MASYKVLFSTARWRPYRKWRRRNVIVMTSSPTTLSFQTLGERSKLLGAHSYYSILNFILHKLAFPQPKPGTVKCCACFCVVKTLNLIFISPFFSLLEFVASRPPKLYQFHTVHHSWQRQLKSHLIFIFITQILLNSKCHFQKRNV